MKKDSIEYEKWSVPQIQALCDVIIKLCIEDSAHTYECPVWHIGKKRGPCNCDAYDRGKDLALDLICEARNSTPSKART